MPIFQQAYFPLHIPAPFHIIWERQIHFCKLKLNVKSLWWGEWKSRRGCRWRMPHASLCSNSISFLLQHGSKTTVAVIWLNTFQISSWSHVIFPSTERRGHFFMQLLNPLVQPSLNASHRDFPALLTEPASLSTLKNQQLNCKISSCTSVYVWY